MGFIDSLRQARKEYTTAASNEDLRCSQFVLPKKSGGQATPMQKASRADFNAATIEDADPLFPKIRLVSRYMSRDAVASAIPPNTEVLTITDLYKQISPPDFKRPSSASPNFVVLGIVATRSDSKTSARGNQFVILTLSDLKYDISLALHGKAYEKFWKVRPGTLIGIFNPGMYAQKSVGEARTPALSVSKDACLVEIGQAKDLGQCESMTTQSKHSKRCKNWVDVRKSHVCDFHIEQKATRSKRPEFNSQLAKLWDPREGSSRTMAVYSGGDVKWKRGLQVDTQAAGRWSKGKSSFGNNGGFGDGFPDAPTGRVFQFGGAVVPDIFDESADTSIKQRSRDKRKLEVATNDAILKKRLMKDDVSRAATLASKPENASSSAFTSQQLRRLGFHGPARARTVHATSRPTAAPLSRQEPSPSRTAGTANDGDDSESELEII